MNKFVSIFQDNDPTEPEDVIVEANGNFFYATLGAFVDAPDITVRHYLNGGGVPMPSANEDCGKKIAMFSYDSETDKVVLVLGALG